MARVLIVGVVVILLIGLAVVIPARYRFHSAASRGGTHSFIMRDDTWSGQKTPVTLGTVVVTRAYAKMTQRALIAGALVVLCVSAGPALVRHRATRGNPNAVG